MDLTTAETMSPKNSVLISRQFADVTCIAGEGGDVEVEGRVLADVGEVGRLDHDAHRRAANDIWHVRQCTAIGEPPLCSIGTYT